MKPCAAALTVAICCPLRAGSHVSQGEKTCAQERLAQVKSRATEAKTDLAMMGSLDTAEPTWIALTTCCQLTLKNESDSVAAQRLICLA